MKKYYIVLVLTLLLSVYCFGQDSLNFDRFNIKINYSGYLTDDFHFIPVNGSLYEESPVKNFAAEFDYSIVKCIQAGAYLGFSRYMAYERYTDSAGINILGNASTALSYGLVLNFQILPLLIHQPGFRFDLYASGRYGGIFLFESEDALNLKRNYFEYGGYMGLAFYPFKHLGLYAEYGYGKYVNLRYGLCFKF